MKKFFYSFIFLILFLPLTVHAASISSVRIDGANKVHTGNKYDYRVSIDVSGLNKDSDDSLGIVGIVYEIDFDDELFTITGFNNLTVFDTEVIKEDGKYYVVNYINENSNSYTCSDGIAHCGNYSQLLNFYANHVDKGNSQITIKDVNVILVPVSSDYEEDDFVYIEGSEVSQSVSVVYKGGSSTSSVAPSSIVKNGGSIDFSSSSIFSGSDTDDSLGDLDSNNYLSSIEIEGYDIDFRKEKLEYTIYVDSKVSELNVNAKAESSLATIDIKGADNLKKNNNKVIISVYSQDKTLRTYTIIVRDKNNTVKKKAKMTESVFKLNIKIDKKIKMIIFISIGVIILISVIVGVVNLKKDKEIDKMLDEI